LSLSLSLFVSLSLSLLAASPCDYLGLPHKMATFKQSDYLHGNLALQAQISP
jgi:hypothetical protein